MSLVHATSNTEREYPCVHCGSLSVNIVREGDDPRLKCNVCNGMFDASQSTAAKEADQIPDPDNPPKPKETAMIEDDPKANPRDAARPAPHTAERRIQAPSDGTEKARIPRTPAYVLIAKDRKRVEYTTKKDLKKVVLKWESAETNYDLYKLEATKAAVKVEFDGEAN